MSKDFSGHDKNLLTEESLNTLLLWLEADRNQAAQIYEKIRRKLIKFFEWRNCHSAEEYTDLTFDRVAKKIINGENITTSDKYLYFHGVALNLIKEYFKKRMPLPMDLDKIPDSEESQIIELENDLEMIARQKKCLDMLPKEEHELIIEFCSERGLLRKFRRKSIAQRLVLSENALRIKIHRIREKLRLCVETGKI